MEFRKNIFPFRDVVGDMQNVLFALKQYCEMLVDLKSAKYGRKYVYGDLRESSSKALSDTKLFVLSDI